MDYPPTLRHALTIVWRKWKFKVQNEIDNIIDKLLKELLRENPLHFYCAVKTFNHLNSRNMSFANNYVAIQRHKGIQFFDRKTKETFVKYLDSFGKSNPNRLTVTYINTCESLWTYWTNWRHKNIERKYDKWKNYTNMYMLINSSEELSVYLRSV